MHARVRGVLFSARPRHEENLCQPQLLASISIYYHYDHLHNEYAFIINIIIYYQYYACVINMMHLMIWSMLPYDQCYHLMIWSMLPFIITAFCVCIINIMHVISILCIYDQYYHLLSQHFYHDDRFFSLLSKKQLWQEGTRSQKTVLNLET